MNVLSFDTETALIRPAQLAPPMVCVTWQRPGSAPGIEHVTTAKARVTSWLEDPSTLFTGHFAAYDMTVFCAQWADLIPAVFNAYKTNRVTCTKKRQQLLEIAGGVFRGRVGEKGKWIVHKYDLADLAKRHLGRPLQKDGWRYFYDRFLDVPIDQWDARAAQVQAWARGRRAELPAVLPSDAPDALEQEIKNLEALIADTPDGARRYPLDDAEIELGVYQSQEKHADYLKDQYRQAYADFVLYLSSTWGFRTHEAGVEALRAELTEAYDELAAELQALSIVRADGSRDMKAIKRIMVDACREYGLPLRRTDAHMRCDKGDACEEHVCLDADACEAVVEVATEQDGDATDCPLVDYAEFTALKKMLTADVKMLSTGILYPIHTRYDLAETGRTTSSKPNIQNLNTGRAKSKCKPCSGKGCVECDGTGIPSVAQRLRPGIRQAFIPRPGKVFAQADFPQLELYTLAQWCIARFGFSKLGDALNAGLDPHLIMASKVTGLSYDECAKNKKRKDVDNGRQIGKAFNFGKPGGMGDKKFRASARKAYNVILSEDQCKEYTAQWYEAFPEMRLHFTWVNNLFDGDAERCTIETLYTQRIRGGTTYCAACNNGFQALGVDCAKAAMCLVAEAEYVDTRSPLFGSRTVAMVHDEIIAETDDGPGAHDAAVELARLMTVGANRYLPDVPILMSKMEPTLMRCWDKNAQPTFDAAGRLVPWSPLIRGESSNP